MKIVITVGARPNFVKAAPLVREATKRGNECILIHTGQHYDNEMDKVFFKELDIPEPDFQLYGVPRSRYVHAIKKTIRMIKPDYSIVLGDTDSSLAAALASCKICKTVHIEAGLRSGNRKMKEEFNRVVIDHVSDIHFCTEISAVKNLCAEGISGILVGNVMIDTLSWALEKRINMKAKQVVDINGKYGLLTIHRSEKTDEDIRKLFDNIEVYLSGHIQIIFPVHPRMKKYEEIYANCPRIIPVPPLGYFEFIDLLNLAEFVITDSGGVQEESSFLGVPCYTIRDETERPVTVTHGTNKIVGIDARNLPPEYITRDYEKEIPMWDGKTSERIISFLKGYHDSTSRIRYLEYGKI